MQYIRIKDGIILRKRICKFRQDIDLIAVLSDGNVLSLDNNTFDFLSNCDGTKNIKELKTLYKKYLKENLKKSFLKINILKKLLTIQMKKNL